MKLSIHNMQKQWQENIMNIEILFIATSSLVSVSF